MVLQMIPAQLRYTVEGATPSFTDGVEQTVERGSQVRLRIKGIRGEMGQMFAIGSIREDYLGYVVLSPPASYLWLLTSSLQDHCCSDCCAMGAEYYLSSSDMHQRSHYNREF